MKNPVIALALTLVLIHLFSKTALAHSGRLNAQGRHAGSKPYHCHRAPKKPVENRPRCGLENQSLECIGANRTTNSDVKNIQRQLMHHCDSLPSDFADGVTGPQTRAALRAFQSAYGLLPDGIYGPMTAKALTGHVTGACN